MRSQPLLRAALGLVLALQVAGAGAEVTDSVLVHVDSGRDQGDGGVCDLVLSLWDSEADGRRVSDPVTIRGSTLVDLKEELVVDFGEDELDDLWLDVSTRCPGREEAQMGSSRSKLQGATLSNHQ